MVFGQNSMAETKVGTRYVVFAAFGGEPLGPYDPREFVSGEIVELTGERNDSVRIRFRGWEYGVDRTTFFRKAKKPDIGPDPQ